MCANTSQAKGRVKRANLTLQDRLVKELRLRGISTREAGNAFAPHFIADFNGRFAKSVGPHGARDRRLVGRRRLRRPAGGPRWCARDRDCRVCREGATCDAGVHATIDYKREAVAERVKSLTDGRGADAIIDMDFSTTAPLLANGILAPHGVLVSYGSNAYVEAPLSFRELLFGSASLRFFLVYDLLPQERRAAIDGLSKLLRADRLRHTVAGLWNLKDIAAAHEAVEDGKLIGNVVVELA